MANQTRKADQVEAIASKAQEVGGRIAQRAEEISGSARFGARTLAKAYPWQAAAGAVAAGFFFGFFLGRVVK